MESEDEGCGDHKDEPMARIAGRWAKERGLGVRAYPSSSWRSARYSSMAQAGKSASGPPS